MNVHWIEIIDVTDMMKNEESSLRWRCWRGGVVIQVVWCIRSTG